MINTLGSVRQRHGSIKLPWRTFVLTLIAIALYAVAGSAPEALVYDRQAIANGEWWRMITAHWVHSDGEHALWDITALLVLGIYCERYLQQRLIPLLLLGCLQISLALWFWVPWIEYYCGLSGILHSLLVAGLWASWQENKNQIDLWILALAILKTLIELNSQTALFTQTAWPILPLAHLYGMLMGVYFGIADAIRHQLYRKGFGVLESQAFSRSSS